MISDLSHKYSDFPFPETVLLSEIARLQNVYKIPSNMVNYLPKCDEPQCIYDESLDIRSSTFDAMKALSVNRIISSQIHDGLLDNLSKARYLLPGVAKVVKPEPTHEQTRRLQQTDDRKAFKKSDAQYSLISRIAVTSSKEKIVDEDTGDVCLKEGPLAMIHNAMKERVRIRVIIRRINRYYHHNLPVR
jgi:hypothetical protein